VHCVHAAASCDSPYPNMDLVAKNVEEPTVITIIRSWHRDVPKMVDSETRWASTCEREAASWPRHGPGWGKMGAERPSRGPRWPQSAPRWGRKGARWAPRWGRKAQERPKVAPRWPQDGPKAAPRGDGKGPRWALRGARRAQERPKVDPGAARKTGTPKKHHFGINLGSFWGSGRASGGHPGLLEALFFRTLFWNPSWGKQTLQNLDFV
jgi:hypothetical protein